jgi:hypothetical protein
MEGGYDNSHPKTGPQEDGVLIMTQEVMAPEDPSEPPGTENWDYLASPRLPLDGSLEFVEPPIQRDPY